LNGSVTTTLDRIWHNKSLSQRMRRLKLWPAAASTALAASPAPVGEIVAAHAVAFFEVPDDGLDCGSAFHLSFDLGCDAALLPRSEHAELVLGGRIVAAVSGIGDPSLNDVADEGLHRAAMTLARV
jgi:hypothetical protein